MLPQSLQTLCEGFDDWAHRHGIALALGCLILKDPSEPLEVGNLAADVGEMLEGHRPNLGAGPLTAIDQSQQAAHLAEREAELAASAE
jgi:hypothetical protein